MWPHDFLSCKVMSKVLYIGAGHTGHVLRKTIAVKVLTPDIQRCDNDWTSVVPLLRNVVSKPQTNSTLYVYYYGRVKLTASAYMRSCDGAPKFTKI